MNRGNQAARCRPQLECLEGRDLLAAGVLDPSFGVGGVVVSHPVHNQFGWDVARQPDGKLVVVGQGWAGGDSDDFVVARYNHDGSPDTSFGTGGHALADFDGQRDGAAGVVIQPDGKIVVAGGSGVGVTNFALARFNPDGTPDATFGTGGLVVTDFGGNEAASAVALQPDGKIVAAGSAGRAWNGYDGFALARYNPDGSLDTTFDGDGMVKTNLGPGGGEGQSMALQPDGKIVVAGFDRFGDWTLVLARYNPDGSPDSGFGVGGLVLTPQPPEGDGEDARDLAIGPDGKIVAAGMTFARGRSDNDLAIARYNPDGSLDVTFGGDGWVTRDLGTYEAFGAVAIQPDGKVVAGGARVVDSVVARFNEDGTPDAGFGTDGLVLNNADPGGLDGFEGMLLEPDGSIVAAGVAGSGFLLARYLVATEPPAFTSAAGTTFAVGTGGEFLITTTGSPAAAVSLEGELPRGVRFVDNGDGTATLRGTPAPGTAGLYEVRLTAQNHFDPDPVQPFILRVREDQDPELAGVSVQGGQKQRSRLTFLDVAFTGPVRAEPGAFRLRRVGREPVQLRQQVYRKDNGLFVVRLTFVTGNRIPNALGDGRYLLTVDGDRILGGDGQPLGGVTEVGFSRVYGDTDGDGTFDRLDLGPAAAGAPPRRRLAAVEGAVHPRDGRGRRPARRAGRPPPVVKRATQRRLPSGSPSTTRLE